MIQVGDVGIMFTFTMVDENRSIVDLSGVTVKEFIFQRPDRTILTVPAAFGTNGNDGVLVYTTQEGDLDQAGTWRYQVYVATNTSEMRHSNVNKFKVLPNLPI